MNLQNNENTNIIWEDFELRRQRNPRFSLRAYSQYLKVSPATLSGFFSGKRSLSFETLTKISDTLNLSPEQKAAVLNSPSSQTSIVDEETFALISEWYYFAILNLLETKSFMSSPTWIAKRLGIPKETARAAWDQLNKMGLVVLKKDKWVRTKKKIHSSDQVSSSAVRRSHLGDLDLIRESILSDGVDRRDSTSLTFPLSACQFQKMIDLIRKFRNEMSDASEKDQTIPTSINFVSN
jgi:transcriptional regulator with XRE-family HTH domain